ncbi:DNA-binding response regulator [Vibrio panuliri]|uniref:DNA-binding response regulator n=1 Tax=Vibrio panuliri TaxID=1381081 RepID=A0A1Q9HK70_9VIBR|nr:response regulator transcription factor [Vibrio panuliri]OLQ90701.1 DNA-binding response regulator [Vibrio panuliri]
MSYTLLIIEDDKNLSDGLEKLLKGSGYECIVLDCLSNAWMHWYQVDLAIIDRHLPDGDAITRIQDWKNRKLIPIIMLSSFCLIKDRVLGLDSGADDYLIKPFYEEELLARIRVNLTKASWAQTPLIVVNKLCIDKSLRQVKIGDELVILSHFEFELLLFFVTHIGRVFTRSELLERVWGYLHCPDTRTIDSHIVHLRKKIPSLNIETLYKVGYRMIGVD